MLDTDVVIFTLNTDIRSCFIHIVKFEHVLTVTDMVNTTGHVWHL